MFVSTDGTSCHEFASQFGLDIFVYAKNTQNYHKYRVAYATVYLNEAATGDSTPAKGGVNFVMVGCIDPSNMTTRMAMMVGWSVFVRECVCTRVCACVSACVRACVHA